MGVDMQDLDTPRDRNVHAPMNVALATPLFVLGGAIIFFSIVRQIQLLQQRRRLKSILRDGNQARFTRQHALVSLYKKYIASAPLFGKRHSREMHLGKLHIGTLPLRGEAILLALFLGINVAFFFCIGDLRKGYTELQYQIRYAAGHLATMNMPGLVLLAGRNNPLIPLVGQKFDVFNFFHRWVGRLVVVGTIVHVAGAYAGKVAEMGVDQAMLLIWTAPFFVWGSVATIAFVLILIQSVSFIRHAFYEVFLRTHITLSAISMGGLYYHVYGRAQANVVLATIILWGLERLARLASLAWCNFGRKLSIVEVEPLPGNVARVNVALVRGQKFREEQYMYLCIPTMGLWTTHPFSVAWVSSAGEHRELTEKEETECSNSSNHSLAKPDDLEDDRQIVSFLIKEKEGFTKKLLKKAADWAKDYVDTKVALVEGPFGGIRFLDSYGTVVLVAGGIGITHPMFSLRQCVEKFQKGATAVRRIRLVWVVRSEDAFIWVEPWMKWLFNQPAVASGENESSESFPPSSQSTLQSSNSDNSQKLDFRIKVFITGRTPKDDSIAMTSPEPCTPTSSASASKSNVNTLEESWVFVDRPNAKVSLIGGKPNFKKILEDEQKDQIGAMAVTVCGPGGMGDDVRAAVNSLERASGTPIRQRSKVDFHEATFNL
ncbi:ferric reductase family protein [Aspergillus stella-maris]|uniref:ferric reductase family protein n=1 Tax=Aspergillus stella-maris TaxID=1810926 RepID=UPI003CCCF992